jgi:ABC-type uncharacterized transport system substrate-binding protein
VNPANPVAASQIQEIREPARSLGLQVHVLEASSEPEIEIAFETLMKSEPAHCSSPTTRSYMGGVNCSSRWRHDMRFP